ncbi:MAG: Fur family transcriptional regulator [Anaerolineae bacterium]|nr:transcriptional repressor [Anaerolineae bacterium]MDW8099191.1 Fur family transcriptional regulator [Anaerolineae bacterium]
MIHCINYEPAVGISELLEALRRSGYKVTRARRMVLEALIAATGHATASDVVTRVQAHAPGVGRASVYRALDLFSQLGLVQASGLGSAATTYTLAPAGHHHHLVCVRCHKIVEFDDCYLADLQRQLAERFGFQINGHLVEMYGRCPGCLEE